LLVSVVLKNSTREYDRFYDYKVPANLEPFVKPGIRVLVPFGRNEAFREAYVMELKSESSFKELKNVYQVLDESPVLNDELIQLSRFMKKRYICTHDLAIRCMIPAGLSLSHSLEVSLCHAEPFDITEEQKEIISILKGHKGKLSIDKLQEIMMKPVMKELKKLQNRKIVEVVNRFQLKAKAKTVKVARPAVDIEEYHEMLENNQIRSINYIRLLDLLFEEGEISVNELKMLGFSAAVIRNMEKKGYLSFTDEPVERDPLEQVDVEKTEPRIPTKAQMKALSVIHKAIAAGSFNEIMLHGVTGSGKTEVYLQVIQEVLKNGKTAIMLVPEIGLTPQAVRLFKGRFGDRVAVLHSRLSIGERYDQWNKIKNGEIPVVIGARSAIFAPLTNIGIIIIDEEHETSYKSDRTPKYDARTIAVLRCRYYNGVVLYGTATPSVENYWRAVTGKIKLVEMAERTNSHPLPEVIMVDMRNEKDKGIKHEFSSKLIGELKKNKDADEQSILFINRRGHSNFLLCKKCGFISICPYCSVSLTWHNADKRLVCHYCGYATVKLSYCPKCNSTNMEPYGLGTQKVEEMLPEVIPGLSVIRMDFDTTSGRRGHEKVLDSFRKQHIDVMVGTQMVAKGHDFPDVTLVGILSADSLLGSGDYRAGERTFQLITQVSGRAGRAEKKGRVVLQTYNPDEFSIQTAIRQDYRAFFGQEIRLRKELCLPPFYQLAVVQVSAKDRKTAQDIARRIHSDMTTRKDIQEGILLSSPVPAPVIRLRNRFRWRIILKHPSIKTLGTVLEWVYDTYYRSKGKSEYTVSVDINPVSMI
jgi:primosomal protein N' (replication factor Y)